MCMENLLVKVEELENDQCKTAQASVMTEIQTVENFEGEKAQFDAKHFLIQVIKNNPEFPTIDESSWNAHDLAMRELSNIHEHLEKNSSCQYFENEQQANLMVKDWCKNSCMKGAKSLRVIEEKRQQKNESTLKSDVNLKTCDVERKQSINSIDLDENWSTAKVFRNEETVVVDVHPTKRQLLRNRMHTGEQSIDFLKYISVSCLFFYEPYALGMSVTSTNEILDLVRFSS